MRKSKICMVLLVLLGSAILILTRKIKHYYQPAEVLPIYRLSPICEDDTIRVLFMGDSWAAYHKPYDTLLSNMIRTYTNRPCKVTSLGFVGAKSKEIYERIFTDAKSVIFMHPDVCIVSAGINDAVAKMGTNYYIKNYEYVLSFLLENGSVPVVIDAPDVDYMAVYLRESFIAKTRHRISSFVTGANMFSFDNYRTALKNMIQKEYKYPKVIYIESNSWFTCELLDKDGIHLNSKGYLRMDSCISTEISNILDYK